MHPDFVKIHRHTALIAGIEKAHGVKHQYPNHETAIRGAAALNKSPKRRNEVEPYPCPFCDTWHIGRLMDVDDAVNVFANDTGTCRFPYIRCPDAHSIKLNECYMEECEESRVYAEDLLDTEDDEC